MSHKKNAYLHIAFNQTTKITKVRKFMKTHFFQEFKTYANLWIFTQQNDRL